MHNKPERYSRDAILEVRSRAERRGNPDAIRAMDDVLRRMGKRKSVLRGFFNPEEKDFIDWALTSDAA